MPRLKGFKHSEETKNKIAASQKGQHHSPDFEIKRYQHISPKTEFKKGHKPADSTRRKWSEMRKGAGNPNWKGGKTPLHLAVRTSLEYRLWRTAVFERDNYTCVWCGARNGNGRDVYLEADHIKSFADYPDLRLAIDNGRTLCKPCHEKTPNYKGRKCR